MATKILVGLVVALLGTGLGVSMAFLDTTPAPVPDQSANALSVSEGGCCSQTHSCCETELQGACGDSTSTCPAPEALAACAGGAVVGNAPAKKKIVALNANAQ